MKHILFDLEKYIPAMSQYDLCEYWKELHGIDTGHFTPELIEHFKFMIDEKNEALLAHFWLLSNKN